ncbi:MAG: M20/M25/M40 family metallo-hydrolase [Phycisphaerales bacterium JB040]
MPLTEQEQHLARAIASRHDDLLEDLRLHVGIPTGKNHRPGLDETRALLSRRLEALGATTELVHGDEKPAWLGGPSGSEIPPTAVCRRLDPGCAASVLIAGHLDTVHDPESPFRSLTDRGDGTATGPGCVDMKGGLVIAVAALEALHEAGVPASWTFTLNSDEETGTYHSERVLRSEASGHDFGLALEPALADGSLAVERMGSGQFRVECFGRSAHVGRAFTEGVSAVTALAERLVSIGGMPDPARGKIVNVGPIVGGAVTNAVPDHAAAWGNVRFPDAGVSEELGRELDALATGPGAMPRVVVDRSFNRPAKPLTPGTEALALRAREVAEGLGQSLPFAKTGGVCDGNILQDAGLPTIDTLGVRGGGLHTPDEWIELDSLVERCQLLAILIARLCAGGSEA